MRVETNFTVDVPPERAWRELSATDILAASLPGVALRAADGADGPGVGYSGELTLGGDEPTARCVGSLRPLDVDEDGHVTTLLLQGRQVGAAAVGSGTVRGRVRQADGATRVELSADVDVAGGRADRKAVEEGARGLLEEWAELLAERIAERAGAPAPAPEPEPSSDRVRSAEEAGPTVDADEGLAAAAGSLARYGPLSAVVALALAVLLSVFGRRRKRVWLRVTWRR